MKLIHLEAVLDKIEVICSNYPSIDYNDNSKDFIKLYKIKKDISKDPELFHSFMYHVLSYIKTIELRQRENICGHISDYISVKLFKVKVCPVAVDIISDLYLELFRDVSKLWDYYSGSYNYPVPSSRDMPDNVSPRGYFWSRHNENTLWEGEYGELRKELLEFCITSTYNKFE